MWIRSAAHRAASELPSLDREHGHFDEPDPRTVGNQPANISLPDRRQNQGLLAPPRRPDSHLPFSNSPV